MDTKPPHAGAHPFDPPEGADREARCRICGERWNYIQHHPTRVKAARALGHGDGTAAGEDASRRSR